MGIDTTTVTFTTLFSHTLGPLVLMTSLKKIILYLKTFLKVFIFISISLSETIKIRRKLALIHTFYAAKENNN